LVSGTAAAQYDSLTRSLTSLGTGTAGGSLLITTLVPGETLSSFSFQVHGTPYDSNYGQVPSTSHVFTLSTTVPVPEPASGLLTCLGATVFLMRRRRRQHCNQATRTKSPPSMLSAAA
ncbi:MAG: PEP-CTERM sorting domain-containing protein, partial [Verrucomicrobium sp.]|nr:PEP-CTERM sorting domain-containing protein [Verrucomicrobium sp.]